MDRQFILVGAVVFMLSVSAGAYLAFSGTEPGQSVDRNTPVKLNVTASDNQDVATASFYNNSIDLLHENREKARFYIDTDRDGSFDIELTDLQHDGAVHNTTEIVTREGEDYRLYFRYSDSPEVKDDAWLTLFRVEKLG